MPKRSEYVEHLVEMLKAFGAVEAKSMFGGWGLYHRGLFFALVAEDTLYFKVDDETRGRFENEGQGPFIYERKGGGKTGMSYFRPPDEALETPAVMAEWARLGYGAALRAAKAKAEKKTTPR